MRFPVHMLTDNIQHQVKHAIKGNKRYPFVLMLEPLYTCNLACLGCAIERHTGKLKDRLSLEKCIEAVDVTGAPVVSICGGEPTIYPELPELVSEIIKRKRQIILCTNGLLLDENLYGKIAPNKRLTINVHLDGMRETHDYVCAREGVFDKAIAMIEEGVKLGHHMMANTTIFKETSMDEVEELCKLLTGHGRRGHARVAGLPVRVGRQRHLPVALGHAEEVPEGARHLEEVQADLDPDVPRVRRGPARLQVLAVVDGDLHAERLEGALLPDRQDLVADVRASSGTGRTGSTGSRGRILSARTARCTRASRPPSSASCPSTPATWSG